MSTPAIRRLIQSRDFGRGALSGPELEAWRLAQAGEFRARNNQQVSGWTQARAAAWAGVCLRSWHGWENGHRPVPAAVVRRIVDYSRSIQSKLDEVLR
ncbi:MAG: hypothetical protein OEO20_11335 [Gemmatimonadota bacterium]|nr:hypothetical protein [Gemmatimonadota bacterium]MDH3291594.1 hypothetical protein [Gemmatimonadota bacterium]MDH3366497.1 hypothetical protein [Gemmatimonadota bacterium]MDH3478886.1 hypothetical protein [Gemmatimonadota bacterium]MDH3571208.1 hypothetical protein [Gemmatimonadota bacterium]